MKKLKHRREKASKQRQEFTLIELLVVISIIATLVALLFPAMAGAQKMVKKVKAKTLMNGIVIAVKQYKTTYGLMPSWPGFQDTDDVKLDDNEYDVLVQILAKRNIGSSTDSDLANRRNIQLLDPPSSFESKGYLDPWDNRFVVLMDRDYDKKITIGTDPVINKQVAVYSFGPDGEDDDGGGDDIASWK